MKVGILGGGVVGRATARAWLEHCAEVRVYDALAQRSTCSLDLALDCDLVFICLPEVTLDSFFDHVQRGILGMIPEGGWCSRNFVLKSTVPIGTTRRLRNQHGLANLVHSPEFLTERCAVWDAQNPARNIIGYPGESGRGPWKRLSGEIIPHPVVAAYEKRFPGVPTHLMTSDESEAVKLFGNAFAAVKVALFNEFRSLADALGLDWDSVVEGVLSDGRIGNAWTKVPGPDGRHGFGGRCLAKDLRSLLGNFDSAKLDCPVLEATMEHCNEEMA